MFPSRGRLAGLAEQEYQAPRCASRACTHLSAEAAEAEALTPRLCNGSEDMAASEQDSEFPLASTALSTLVSKAFRWDRAVSEVASAAASSSV